MRTSTFSKRLSHTTIGPSELKLGAHLWYLSEELIPLLLFDPESLEEKYWIVTAMRTKEGSDEPFKCTLAPQGNITLGDLAMLASNKFFKKMQIWQSFLDEDPESWSTTDDCITVQIIAVIRVMNDNAEWAVALIEEYNGKITHDEQQLQFLVQVVAEHRSRFPDSKEMTLTRTNKA